MDFGIFCISGFCILMTRVERAGSHRDKTRFNKVYKILMRSLVTSGCQVDKNLPSQLKSGNISFFLRFYLFIHERDTEREAET